MRVLRLRTHYGVPALKGENSWGAGDPGTELRMLQCGHFVVSKYAKHVIIPGAAIVSADVEPERSPMETNPDIAARAVEINQALADQMQKRGPGRPKKEPVPA